MTCCCSPDFLLGIHFSFESGTQSCRMCTSVGKYALLQHDCNQVPSIYLIGLKGPLALVAPLNVQRPTCLAYPIRRTIAGAFQPSDAS